MKKDDPIIAEVRRAREKHAAKFGFDLKKICKDLRKIENTYKRRIIQPKSVRKHIQIAA